MITGKTSLDYTNSFSRNNNKKVGKEYISTLRTNITKEM